MKNSILILAALLAAPLTAFSAGQSRYNQNNTTTIAIVADKSSSADDSKIYRAVEQPASFPGGMNALMQWMCNNIKYPAMAAENGIQGRVVVQFVIKADGSITDVRVVRGVDAELDKEAVRVVKSMPKWIPGRNDGKDVNTYFTLPVTFKLNAE